MKKIILILTAATLCFASIGQTRSREGTKKIPSKVSIPKSIVLLPLPLCPEGEPTDYSRLEIGFLLETAKDNYTSFVLKNWQNPLIREWGSVGGLDLSITGLDENLVITGTPESIYPMNSAYIYFEEMENMENMTSVQGRFKIFGASSAEECPDSVLFRYQINATGAGLPGGTGPIQSLALSATGSSQCTYNFNIPVEEIISTVGGYHHILAEACAVSGDKVWKNRFRVNFDVGSVAGAGNIFLDFNEHDIDIEFYGPYLEAWEGFKVE